MAKKRSVKKKRPRDSKRRLVILTEGNLGVFDSKTAVSTIRYCRDEVVCILDSKAAGKDPEKIIGVGKGIPIVKNIKDALKHKPNALLIGIAPVGGKLPEAWRVTLKAAMAGGLDIIAGLHTFLNEDADLAKTAKRHRRTIWDVRVPPADLDCSKNVAKDTKCHRVLTVGSDCNLGKMTVSLELTAEAKRRGWDAKFVATGQTGIVIAGSGIPIDRTISDFTNGAAERLVLENKKHEILFVEGQGAIGHPAYSAVTLGLLHGTAPDAMILCHQPGRKLTHSVETKIPKLKFLIKLHEKLAGLICPSKVVGIGVNTFGMPEKKALAAIKKIEKETRLPAADVFRTGAGKLMDALDKHYGRKKHKAR